MPDYKKELTRLFKKYNPDKVQDVETLLAKFAGREEELIATVHAKYGVNPAEEKSNRKPKIILLLAVMMTIFALGSWYAAKEGLFDFKENALETNAELADAEDEGDAEEEFLSVTEIVGENDAQQNMEAGDVLSEKENEALKNKEAGRAFLEEETLTSAPPMEYGVQIGLYSVADNAEVRKMLGDAQMYLSILPTEAGKYMYVVGADTELNQARTRRDQLRKGAFPDAFVVGLRKGKRVDIFQE